MDAKTLQEQYRKAMSARDKTPTKEVMSYSIHGDRVSQIEVYRVTFVKGAETYLGYLHEYTRNLVKDPIYKDIDPIIFVPEWYELEDYIQYCKDLNKTFNLFENPQIKVVKIGIN